jgi:DNA (cytosine-5)-methyltransferase 1
MQAGHQGLPQSRRRFFVWGALRGRVLPEFEQPTHCFPKTKSLTIALPGGHKYSTIRKPGGHAPYGGTKAGDALSDLPAFEFRNPRVTCDSSIPDARDRVPPPEDVPRLSATNSRSASIMMVGKDEQSYASAPLNAYQRRMRSALGHETKEDEDGDTMDLDVLVEILRNHYTRTFNDTNVERICHVPFGPGHDHHSTFLFLSRLFFFFKKRTIAREKSSDLTQCQSVYYVQTCPIR